jgi:hypothetical protein
MLHAISGRGLFTKANPVFQPKFFTVQHYANLIAVPAEEGVELE